MNKLTMLCLLGAGALTACGGGAPDGGDTAAAAEQPTASGTASGDAASGGASAGGAAAAVTGKTWDVKMLGDDKGYRFEPAALTIKTGDAVRFINASGPPHNVAFWADSIPSGAAASLEANMPQAAAPLTGPLLNGLNESYTVNFAKAPPGPYGYYCTVHLGMGMVAKITVQ